jgi:hypothetical protein
LSRLSSKVRREITRLDVRSSLYAQNSILPIKV